MAKTFRAFYDSVSTPFVYVWESGTIFEDFLNFLKIYKKKTNVFFAVLDPKTYRNQ